MSRSDHQRPSGSESDIERHVLNYARTHPEMGQAKVAEALSAQGHEISPSGVRYIWQRHQLETTTKRLQALARHNPKGKSAVLSPRQTKVLERAAASRKIARLSAAIGDDAGSEQERSSLILLAAARLFAERGYEGTSVRDIAETVGLLPGSIYHHYPSKEDLFVSVHREGFRQLTVLVDAAVAQGTTPRQRLELLCAAHIDALVAVNPITTVAGKSLFGRHAPALEKRLASDRQRYEDILRTLIAALPLKRGIDQSLLRKFILGALNWTLVWYKPGGKSPGEIAAQLMAQLLPEAK